MPASSCLFRRLLLRLLIWTLACWLTLSCCPARSLTVQRNVSTETARRIPSWLREGVIYEIFPRAFSRRGDLNGVASRLDDLKNLGVTILWLTGDRAQPRAPSLD